MPTWLAPGYLLAAALASVAVIVVHLLAWRRPTPQPLPTARFAPASPVRAVSRDLRLSDVLLLLLRVLALLLAGAALARPSTTPRHTGTARVVVLDASRRVASVGEVGDSASAVALGADAVSWVRVDSVARLLPDTSRASLGARADVPGRLGAGIVAGIREANRLAESHARVDVVVVSPFAAESWDEGAVALRMAWPGEMRAVRVAARSDGSAVAAGDAPPHELPPASDPIGAAFALGVGPTSAPLRVTRLAPGASDSAWARRGAIVVWWPEAPTGDSATTGSRPAVLTSGSRGVAGRYAALPGVVGSGRVILRWGDGTPAATESRLGDGCLRAVGVGVPPAGDDVLRPGFLRLVGTLAEPCGGGSGALVDSAALEAWARADTSDGGAPRIVTADAAAIPDSRGSLVLVRWLLIGAALVLTLESWLRARRRTIESPGARGLPDAPREAV